MLTDDSRRSAMRRRVYAGGRSMTWPRIAQRYLTTFESARHVHRPRLITRPAAIAPARDSQALPALRIAHFLSLCDDTGLFQHALHCVPDRSHGYCTDDNARALLLSLLPRKAWRSSAFRCIDEPIRRLPPACLESPIGDGFEISSASTVAGSRNWVRRTVMGARSGPWANARSKGAAPRCVDGRWHCSWKPCRLLKASVRRAHGVLRCLDWTPTALRRRKIAPQAVCAACSPTGWWRC